MKKVAERNMGNELNEQGLDYEGGQSRQMALHTETYSTLAIPEFDVVTAQYLVPPP